MEVTGCGSNGFGSPNEEGWDDLCRNLNEDGAPKSIIPSLLKHYVYHNVPIQFPYEAYKSQHMMMDKMIEGLLSGENCLLESPTGTGKTAALLCALLGWQNYCKEKKDNCGSIIEAAAERLGKDCTCGLTKDKERTKVIMEWCKEKRCWELISTTPTHASVIIDDLESPNTSLSNSCPTTPTKPSTSSLSSSHLSTSCPTTPNLKNNSTSKTLNSTIGWEEGSPSKKLKLSRMGFHDDESEVQVRTLDNACVYCVKKHVYDRSRPPKIYYCTRTHSQISQVVKQLKGTAYGGAKMTILASREPTCISKKAAEAVSSSQNQDLEVHERRCLNDVCREWKKNYFIRMKMKQKNPDLYERLERGEEVDGVPPLPPVCNYFAFNNELLYKGFDAFQREGAWDFEDIKKEGEGIQGCPYYGSYAMQNGADIIFGSYNYLIDPSLRTLTNIKYINSVLVFDEAHNIEDICRTAFNLTLDVENFQANVFKPLTSLLDKLTDEEVECTVRPSTVKAFKELKNNFENWINVLMERGNKMRLDLERNKGKTDAKEKLESEPLSQLLKKMGMDLEGVDKCLGLASKRGADSSSSDDEEETQDIFSEETQGEEDNDSGNGTGKDYYVVKKDPSKRQRPFKLPFGVEMFLKSIRLTLKYLCEEEQDGVGGAKDFVGYLTCSVIQNQNTTASGEARRRSGRNAQFVAQVPNNQPKINYIFQILCLNPAVGFRVLRNTAYSIIVASGTLTPLNSFSSELATNFGVTLQADHVIPSSNVFAGVISVGPDNVALSLTKDQQDDLSIQDEIGNIISEICNSIPNGVLVFFPSYSLMRKLEARWRNYPSGNNVFSKIGRKKHIFFEEARDKKRFKEQMETYKEEVKGGLTWDGCVLFAVFRGKISEGIDFADEQARCVVTIGIPYSNLGAAEIVSKREYNDMRNRNKKPGEHILSGSEWYTTQAFRAMNQGFGRCVRHRDDWGALVMIDSRMGLARNDAYISGWVKKKLKVFNKFEVAKKEIELFVKARSKQDQFRIKRKSPVKIEYETEEEENRRRAGTSNPSDLEDTEIIRSQDVHELETQRVDMFSPPGASSSTPSSSQRVSQSSPEYSFDEEIDQILGTQEQQSPGSQSPQNIEIEETDDVTQMVEERRNENDSQRISDAWSQSSCSVFGESPERDGLSPAHKRVARDTADYDENELLTIAENMQREIDRRVVPVASSSTSVQNEGVGLDNSDPELLAIAEQMQTAIDASVNNSSILDVSMASVSNMSLSTSQLSQASSISYHSDLEV